MPAAVLTGQGRDGMMEHKRKSFPCPTKRFIREVPIMTKKLLSLLLCMLMLLALCGTAFADAPIEWEISKKGVLTISGDGELPDYSYVAPPWENRRHE